MKIIKKIIKFGQRLIHALGGSIKSNTIVGKTICGCGATYSEIKAPRHSIIVEPNLPVIKGKEKDHPEVFGVYEGRNRPHIKKYVNQMVKEGKHMKFLTTPESFRKIRDALMEMGLDLYADFFLLFDECERTIQDIGYRGSIVLPMDDFFHFRNKAMISATPIIPSDPRFIMQGFDMVKLIPDYNYKQEIEVITTNNIVAVLRDRFNQWSGKPICVFINSTDTIYNIICTFGLQDRSKVFCSEKSVKKLKELGYSNVSDSLGELAEITFFTCRFNSAVDIILDYQPNVMIVTDVYRAVQTMVDPKTEVPQILGRFRNGTAERVHITNYKSDLEWKTEEEMEEFLKACEKFYKDVASIQIDPKSEGGVKSKKEAKEGMDYHRFVKKDGTRNYFMWDNAQDDERIKSYYQDITRLLDAYKDSPLVAVHTEKNSLLGEDDYLRRTKPRIAFNNLCKELVRQLNILQANQADVEYTYLMSEIKRCFDFIVDAYFVLGGEKLDELGYNKKKIENALKDHRQNIRFTDPKVVKAVYDKYKEGDFVVISDVIDFFKKLVKEYNIPYTGRYDSNLMKIYFEIYRTSRTKAVRMIELGERLL